MGHVSSHSARRLLGAACLLLLTVRHSGAQETWAETCHAALSSRAPLVQACALLALRDRTVDNAAEVVYVYCREKDPLVRRRVALVLGEASVLKELQARAQRRHPEISEHIKALGSPNFAKRDAASAALRKVLLFAEGRLRQAASSPQLEVAFRARRMLEPLDRHGSDCLPEATDPETELWRWATAASILHQRPGADLPPFWSILAKQEQEQVWRMHLVSGWRELRGPDGGTDLDDPWPAILRSVLCEYWQLPGYQGHLEELTPPFAPLAPLVRVAIFRRERASRVSHVFGRCLLAGLGDERALDGLDLTGVEDAEGWNALRAATATARLGRLEGVESLWELARTHSKPAARHDAQERLHRLLDLGVAPFPTVEAVTLVPWLTPKEREALKPALKKWSNWTDGDTKPLYDLLASARLAFMKKLRAVYDHERPNLVWSPMTRQFHPSSQAPAKAAARPIHPALVHLGPEDAAARAWYAACASHAFHRDLGVSVGAVRALLWGEAAAAAALLNEAKAHLREGRAEEAAFLVGLGRLLPPWTSALASEDAATRAALARAATEQRETAEFPTTLLRAMDGGTLPRDAAVLDQLRPIHLPVLLVYQERSPLMWDVIIRLDAPAARPFLLRELARERVNERRSPPRGSYPSGYFMYLFRAFAHYQMREAVPVLIRYASSKESWPAAAVIPLGAIGGDEALTFLKAKLPETDPLSPDEYRLLIEVALARNGDHARLERCVEVLRKGSWGVPRNAAEALKACLPFAGPDFARETSDPPPDSARERVHAVWQEWLERHRDHLHWEPERRRYVLR